MTTKRLIPFALLPALWSTGCASMTQTDKGVAAGGLLGAGTGALIGNAVGHTGAGAIIGAGLGAITGGLIGNAVEESEKRTEAKVAAAQAAQGRLGITDVVTMAQNHISDDVIISQLRTTGSSFRLSSNDTIWLKQQGVSDRVVQEMLASASRAYPYGAPPPVVYTRPVYVIEEAPPPPVSFGFGFTSVRRW
jgi:hypothetical protein